MSSSKMSEVEEAVDFALVKRQELRKEMLRMRAVYMLMEGISLNFLYALPEFAFDLIQAARESYTCNSEAVRQAKEILERRRKERSHGNSKQGKNTDPAR